MACPHGNKTKPKNKGRKYQYQKKEGKEKRPSTHPGKTVFFICAAVFYRPHSFRRTKQSNHFAGRGHKCPYRKKA
jgi:hypothetical protein